MLLPVTRLVLVLAVGDLVIAASNNSLLEVANELVIAPAIPLEGGRRAAGEKKKKNSGRSTSSDSKDKIDNYETDKADDASLGLSDDDDEESGGEKKKHDNKYFPKSSDERHGWRKWHRKCTPCDEDQKTKWRNPGIKWICGAFQTARRSFKSPCVMRLRNCQDGTMFVKIHDHRCTDDPERGKHFFYDYKVRLTDESAKSSDSSSSNKDPTSSSSGEARRAFNRRRAGGTADSLVLNGTVFNVTATTSPSSNVTLVTVTAASGNHSNSTTARQPQISRINIDQVKS